MGIEFNADEIFEMAEQMERNGAKFYRKAARAIKDESAASMFKDLAVMEDDHEKAFAGMRSKLSAEEKKPTVFDPDDQAGLYLRAMADGHVFDMKADPSANLTGKESVSDVLRTAIGLEKDSVLFYLGLKSAVPPRLGQAWVEGIIEQEMNHIAALSQTLRVVG